jgi:hypothetical protein
VRAVELDSGEIETRRANGGFGERVTDPVEAGAVQLQRRILALEERDR